MADRECWPKQYGKTRECEGPPKFDVVYRDPESRKVLDQHPACLRHAVAEVERHQEAAGMAVIDIIDTRPWWLK